ncbi:MAG: hypothetical protein HAW66_03525, partial [Shewanella sp.]|nr:hypothetical protein [Shewanella sp.]
MKFDPVSGDLNVESGNGFIGQSGHIILLPNGMLVASNALAFTSRLNKISDAPNGIVAHHWTQQGELITLQYLAGNTLLSRWDNKLHQIDKKEFSGAPVALMGNGSELVIITNTVSTYRTHDYQVSDDSDNDGVANAEDKFPSDIAASIDTDEDGYPDSWNTGYTEQDSTSNLVLDAFLADFSCWLTEHGNSTESCDYSATFTNYIPEIVETGANENIYLYAQSHNAVYRWSTTTNQYIAPIRVGKKVLSMSVNPTAMAKSDAHGRIYLGYGDGKITYLDLTNAQEFIEQVFYTYTQPIGAISDAGNFILVQDLGEYSDNQIVLDVNGSVSDTKANYTNKFDHSIWNESNSYLYLIKPGNRLRYMNIDQSTGQIVDEGYAVYNHDDAPSGPIRISNDGTKVLLASGQLYNANDLNKIHNYGDIVDGRWLENDELVLLSQLTDHINYYRFNDNNRELEQGSLAGELVEFVMAGSTPVIISQVNERLVFTTFVANDDTDGDSVPNLVDAFPLDPAASIDSDNDGYPDEWNAGYTEADSTTNLVLDSFSNDSACWLSSHDDGNGQCNYRATLPTFTPD